MSANRVATARAGDCDWTCASEPFFQKAVDKAVRKAVSRFPDVASYDDCAQDAWMWLAVRPTLIANYRSTPDEKALAQNIYAGLKGSLVGESDRQNTTLSRDAWLDKESA